MLIQPTFGRPVEIALRPVNHALSSVEGYASGTRARLAAAEAWYVCLIHARQSLWLCHSRALKGHVIVDSRCDCSNVRFLLSTSSNDHTPMLLTFA